MSTGEAKVASESASSYALRMPDAWSPSGHRGLRAREKLDLIFSNAALHWVADHPALLQRLTAALAPGGQLAVQMPMADELVTHRTAYALARSAEFPRSSAAPVRAVPFPPTGRPFSSGEERNPPATERWSSIRSTGRP